MKTTETQSQHSVRRKVLRRPATWERVTGIIILDRDGWRTDGKSFYQPLTRAEWNRRQMISTCMCVQRKNAI
jgi:hypothetical protein